MLSLDIKYMMFFGVTVQNDMKLRYSK